MNLLLKDKVIIVTGGARGIGFGIVDVLAKEGAIPVIIGRDEADNLSALDKIKKAGANGFQITAELSKPDECRKAVDVTLKQFGKIEGLVNNAGVNDGVGLEYGSYERFMESLHNNLVHYYLMAHFALPSLKQTKGSIVNIGSKTAETGQGNTSAYAASNGGRNALTREWAVELLKYGIRVNEVVVTEGYTSLYEKRFLAYEKPEEKLRSAPGEISL